MLKHALRTFIATALLLGTMIQAAPARSTQLIAKDRQPELIANIPSPGSRLQHGVHFPSACVKAIDPKGIGFQISNVAPANPLPNQSVVMAFTLTNNSKLAISGNVVGSVSGTKVQLESLPADYAKGQGYDDSVSNQPNAYSFSLAAGAKVNGALGWHAASAGTSTVVLEVDQDTCPYTIRDVDMTTARLASASYSFNISEGLVLTSTDRQTNLPRPSEDVCGPIGQHHIGVKGTLLGKDIDIGKDVNGHAYPFGPNQWAEVVPDAIVPVVGTVLPVYPREGEEGRHGAHVSSGDVPFNHPFGYDWVWYLHPDADWKNLLDVNSTEYQKKPRDFLESEIEKRLLPDAYRPKDGDRVLQYGRWIIDCGEDFHSETHPPALLAVGRSDQNLGDVQSTLIAVPYRTRENYSPDNYPLLLHCFNEVWKLVNFALIPDSVALEAPPVIDGKSFTGKIVAQYHLKVVRGQPGYGVNLRPRLYYHFNVRPGSATSVHVAQADPFSADVTVTLDMTGSGSPNFTVHGRGDPDSPIDFKNESSDLPVTVPTCWKKSYGTDVVDNMISKETDAWKQGYFTDTLGGLAVLFPSLQSANLAQALSAGIYVLQCNIPQPLDPSALGADNQVVIVPNQLYPLIGKVQIKWEKGPPSLNPLIPPRKPPVQ